ncbi:MAG: prepilin-type N-terminal cleavage/methylation domain-containing protein [Candidatus Omnitrophica bacterium]|nr:prepilin-type N-terminal cleavage/methylation domain-containing protein [Candidatus Omnitrophota bacterium]
MRKYILKKAFTLIELLIVIVIIGILASLALNQYEQMKARAAGVEAMRNLRALSDSIWRYYVETGHFPLGSDVLITDVLDVKIPGKQNSSNPKDIDTKYFLYEYDPSLDLGAVSWDNDDGIGQRYGVAIAQDLATGSISVPDLPTHTHWYFVGYSQEPTTTKGQPGQSMGNGWYRYYARIIFTRTPGGGSAANYRCKIGWQ